MYYNHITMYMEYRRIISCVKICKQKKLPEYNDTVHFRRVLTPTNLANPVNAFLYSFLFTISSVCGGKTQKRHISGTVVIPLPC